MIAQHNHLARLVTSLALAVFFTGIAACGGKPPELPAVQPDQVEIYLPGQQPSESYKSLKTFELSVNIDGTNEELVTQAVQQAAALGADALIITKLGPNTSGATGAALGTDAVTHVKRILQGQAVYYPSRHPELQEEKD